MANDLLVVSLGRILADEVRVEPDEGHAVLQHLWQYLRGHRANDGGLPLIPALDRLGLTAFGDFEVRASATIDGVVRPPSQVARELAELLIRLVKSGRNPVEGAAARCLAVAQRTLTRETTSTARPITAPEGLLRALEAFRPRDASMSLAALFARWMRATDTGRATKAPAPALGLALGIGQPRNTVSTPAATRDTTSDAAGPPVEAAPRLLFAETPTAPVVRTAGEKGGARRDAAPRPPVAARTPAPAPVPDRVARVVAPDLTLHPSTGLSTFTPSLPSTRPRRMSTAAIGACAAGLLLVVGGAAVVGPASATNRLQEVARSAFARVGGSPAAVDPAHTSESRPAVEPGRARQVIGAQDDGQAPYAPSFDPTTHKLVFHAGQDRPELREADLDAEGDVAGVSTLRVASARSNHAQISPDGQLLAFDSDADGTRGVYVASRDGSNPRRVSGIGHAAVPSWSPDGQSIAFARAEPGKPQVWNVWTVHVPTGRLERRTAHRVGQPWGASWFPDGRRIAYNLENALIVRDLDSGKAETFNTPVPGRRVRTPAVSPDGTRIVFQVRDDGAWVLDLASGTPSRILADASAEEFAWSPDGRRLAYHSLRGGEWGIWLLDVAP